MKTLLHALFVLLFLLVALFIAGLFLPSEHKIVVKKQIDIPRNVVFELVNNFSNWKEWSPWMQKDKNMEITQGRTSAGRGAELEWKSSIYGNCQLTISQSVVPENVAVNFDFGTKSKTSSLWYFEQTDDGTIVNWTLGLSGLSIWERYLVLFNKKPMKQLIESGAESLDSLSRSFSRSRIGEIEVKQLEALNLIVMADTIAYNEANTRKTEMFNYINNFFVKRNLTVAGNPFSFIKGNVNDSLEVLICGIPVSGRTWVWKTLSYNEIPSSKVVVATHYGFPTDKAHRSIKKYIADKGLKTKDNPPLEEYLYNAETDKDTVNWQTKVYYLVE